MDKNEKTRPAPRSYPTVYEKIIPVALIILLVAFALVLLLLIAIVLRLFPGISF
jgi:hypothetical protein